MFVGVMAAPHHCGATLLCPEQLLVRNSVVLCSLQPFLQQCRPSPRREGRKRRGPKATAARKPVILRIRGRAPAEIGQLKGETQSKSYLLLRRGHSFLKVRKVTCDSLQQRWRGNTWST